MMVVAVAIGLLMVLTILAPFFFKGESTLQINRFVNSVPRLEAEKKALVKRYVSDEADYLGKKINKLMWEQRRQFLINRYLDAARRLDYLRYLSSLESKQN